MKNIKVKDRVSVYHEGQDYGYGTVVNENDFREPSKRYAVDLDILQEDDVLFYPAESLTVLNNV